MRRGLISLFTMMLVGCAGAPGTDDLVVVDDGKADNYYSSVATEYALTGSLPVAIDAATYADPVARQQSIRARLTAVGVYLTAYLSDKFGGEDVNGDGVISADEIFFQNDGYGGFHAMVRNASIAEGDITKKAPGKYAVRFTIDVAGPRNLTTRIPRAAIPAGARFAFDLKTPAGVTLDPAAVDDSAIRSFDPAKYDGALDTIRLSVQTLATPGDAYPHYAAFFADGVYDVTLVYGYDYNTPRGDVPEAKDAYDLLKGLGFQSPVESFAALKRDSGPLVKTTQVAGQPLRIEVRIFHADMFTDERAAQRASFLAELNARDVFLYRGHSGPYYGFYLDPDKTAQIDYLEIAGLPMAAKPQLFVAQGCQTYSQYADMFYANPAKTTANLDVITTVNFSNWVGTTTLVEDLLTTDAPVDYYQLIGHVNDLQFNHDQQVFYGVNGIDDDPKLHPYANVDAIGQACHSAVDCGDPAGNLCATVGTQKQCGAVSLAAAGCPSGSHYRQLASASTKTIKSGACF